MIKMNRGQIAKSKTLIGGKSTTSSKKISPQLTRKISKFKVSLEMPYMKKLSLNQMQKRRKSSKSRQYVKLLPTYRLEPPPGRGFPWRAARGWLNAAAQFFFGFENYDHMMIKTGMKRTSDVVVNRLQDEPGAERYKIVCHVTVAQLRDQTLLIASRALGHRGLDACWSLTLRRKEYVAVLTVFAVYKE